MAGPKKEGFDAAAAGTRSLLGWGVVAGVFYLVVGVTQGLLRDGFSFREHALSLLMLGDLGWIQTANLILTGLMVVAAVLGFARAMRPDRRSGAAGTLLGVFGVSLVASGVFPPDPVDSFPDPGSAAVATTSGILHLASGAIGFVALVIAAWIVARWLDDRNDVPRARSSRLAAAVILVGFAGGAALAPTVAGILLLWLAVVAAWIWLAATSLYLYRTVPHPDLERRQQASSSQAG